jgi:uncharacterized membrane protein
MSWVTRYQIRLYVRNSIWILPVLSIAAGLIVVKLVSSVETSFGWTIDLSPDTGRAVMATVASSLFSLVVIGSSAVLLVVQLAEDDQILADTSDLQGMGGGKVKSRSTTVAGL